MAVNTSAVAIVGMAALPGRRGFAATSAMRVDGDGGKQETGGRRQSDSE